VGTLTRRVAADRVVNLAAKARRPAKPPRAPRTLRGVELLRRAQEWRRQLEAGEVRTQADIARKERVTRARVTQVMGMLRLAPENQEQILAMSATSGRPALTERALRPIVRAQRANDQDAFLHDLLVSKDHFPGTSRMKPTSPPPDLTHDGWIGPDRA